MRQADFKIENGVLTEYFGKGKTFVVPEGVKEIGAGAFSDAEELRTIVFPEGLTKIRGNAFHLCSNLEKIVLPKSLKEVGDKAFALCDSLIGVTFNSPVKIGYAAFRFCDNLRSVSGAFTGIGEYAFENCENLESIDISILKGGKIGKAAFSCCYGLKSAAIHGDVKKIPNYVFFSCEKLEQVHLSDNIEVIGSNAFLGCAMKDIKLPKNLKRIEELAFCGCEKLKQISLPAGLEGISTSAFSGCKSLSEVTCPESVKVISRYAFNGCDNLETVAFSCKTKVCLDAFRDCKNLSRLILNMGDKTLDNKDICKNFLNPGIFDDSYLKANDKSLIFQKSDNSISLYSPKTYLDLYANLSNSISAL